MEEYLKRLPQQLKDIIMAAQRISEQAGVRVYLVGGFVRDLILGVPNLDMDLVVEGDGLKFAEELCTALGGKLTRHRRFGTATVFAQNKLKIDVATARKEVYANPGALPNVSSGEIKDDLFRRDFTINAMAISISKKDFGAFIDFFGGKVDLAHKHIRVMHDLSFEDDPTRILRAVRFEQRYGLKIEAHTNKLLKSALRHKMLEHVDRQRIRDEIILTLKEKEPIKYIIRIHKLMSLSFINPGVKFTQSKILFLKQAKKEITWFKETFPKKRLIDDWLIYLIVILGGLKRKEILHFSKSFALRAGEQMRIISYVDNFDKINKALDKKSVLPSAVYRLLEPLSYEVIVLFKALTNRKLVKKHIEDFLKIYNGMRIHVNGEDLKSLGVMPSPHFKKLLIKLLYAKIDRQFKTKEEEISFVKTLLLRSVK